MTHNPIMQDDGQFHELSDLLHEAESEPTPKREIPPYRQIDPDPIGARIASCIAGPGKR